MGNSMHVSPDSLADSAARADRESQTLFARHSSADTAVDSAAPGWVGASRDALAGLADSWVRTTTGLSVRIYRNAEALRVSGLTFAEMEAEHARRLGAIGPA